MNYGLTREELSVAASRSSASPSRAPTCRPATGTTWCWRERVREGIREAGGIAFEFPVHPIQETGKRPTASLDRNLAYLGLVEILYGYPIDGVVLTTGCDKTTPSQLMAAATVDIPAIVLSGGPMLNGWFRGERTGSGTIVWKARQMHAAGEISYEEFVELVASSAPSPGHCNTMGTASTMNSLAEALGMSLPGCAAPPAPHKERAQLAYETGKRIVDMVWEDLRPSKIMTREAFENVIVVNSAIGGSTNAPIHFNAIARHIGVEARQRRLGEGRLRRCRCSSICNRPASYLGEEYHRAGGVPAVVNELMKAGKIHEDALTVNGRTDRRELRQSARCIDPDVIRPYKKPLKDKAGFLNLKGNLFDSAIMKTERDLRGVPQALPGEPEGPQRLRGPRHRVRRTGGLPQAHRRSRAQDRRDLPAVHARHRPGRLSGRRRGREHAAAELPDQEGRHGALPCIGDGRQSGTSGSPSILNASPEAATGGGLAILKTGDRVRIDLNKRSADILISKEEYDKRRADAAGPWRLQVSRPSDALAGDPARHGRRAVATAWC